MGEKVSSDVMLKYVFPEVPDGYFLWQEIVDQNQGIVLYAQEDTGNLLKITCAPNDGTGAMFLVTTTEQKSTVRIGDITADFYQSESEDSSSTIAWIDPENDYLVCVDGFFSKDELIALASSVVKIEVPKSE